MNTAHATCPAGTLLLGGGGGTSSNVAYLQGSNPADATTWQARGVNTSGLIPASVSAYAICSCEQNTP
jgi:hypothetical protein